MRDITQLDNTDWEQEIRETEIDAICLILDWGDNGEESDDVP